MRFEFSVVKVLLMFYIFNIKFFFMKYGFYLGFLEYYGYRINILFTCVCVCVYCNGWFVNDVKYWDLWIIL